MLPFVTTRSTKLAERKPPPLQLCLRQISVYLALILLVTQCTNEVCAEDAGSSGIGGAAGLAEDDMIFNEEQKKFYLGPPPSLGRNALKGEKWRWPKAEVVYELDPAFSSDQKNDIMRAMKHIEDKTVVRFRTKKKNDKDFVKIRKIHEGCTADVGRQGGVQYVNYGGNCFNDDNRFIVHELTHTIGLRHEQCRSDRDDWVDINWENVRPELLGNYKKYTVDEVEHFGVKYNYHSLVHYRGFSLAINGSIPTMIPKREGKKPEDLGPKDGNLTAEDIQKINLMHANVRNQGTYVLQSYLACMLCYASLINVLSM